MRDYFTTLHYCYTTALWQYWIKGVTYLLTYLYLEKANSDSFLRWAVSFRPFHFAYLDLATQKGYKDLRTNSRISEKNTATRSILAAQNETRNYMFSFYYARQHICYSAYMLWQFRLSVCLSVCPSVTQVDQSKTVEARITQFSPYSSPIPLVFRG